MSGQDQSPRRKRFLETFSGQASLVLLGAVVAGLFTLIGPVDWSPSAPIATVAPESTTARAGETIQLDASASRDPDGGELAYSWTVGGVPFSVSSVSSCAVMDDTAHSTCRFAQPGTFAVSVSVRNEDELSAAATATVTVEIEGGYFGLSLAGLSGDRADAAYRELLYQVDWVAIQPLISRPIVLYNPDTQSNVYAVSFSGSEAPEPTGALAGVKIMLPPVSQAAQAALAEAIQQLGGVLVPLPARDIFPGLETGLAEGGFVPLSRPDTSLRELGGDKQ